MRKMLAGKTLGSSYALLRISHKRIFPDNRTGGCHLFKINSTNQFNTIQRSRGWKVRKQPPLPLHMCKITHALRLLGASISVHLHRLISDFRESRYHLVGRFNEAFTAVTFG